MDKQNQQASKANKDQSTQKSLGPKSKTSRAGLITLIVGIIILIAGAAALVVRLTSKPGLRDAEYLVEVGTWTRADAPGVIWQFTSVGTGTLTTNSHVNDYDFIWSLDGNQLKIETSWLYTLDDTYTYSLNQSNSELLLTSTDHAWTFVPLELPAEATPAKYPPAE